MNPDVLGFLLEGLFTSSAACLVVLLLRRPWRHVFGSSSVPLLWALIPAALLAVALPAPVDTPLALHWVNASPQNLPALQVIPGEAHQSGSGWPLLSMLWLLGVLLSATHFALQQRRYLGKLGTLRALGDGVLLGSSPEHGPAVVGLLRPRIILPSDFESRFGPVEQELILAHERSHLRRGDIVANALATLLRTLYWFNPLLHFAAARMRHDHELASDADVVAQYPHARRRYADTLLNVQLAVPGLPVGCLWQSSHPLKERITMLKRLSSSQRKKAGSALAVLALLSLSALAWAAQPQSVAADAKAGASSDAKRDVNAAAESPPGVSYNAVKPPRYPAEAIEAGQSGSVLLKVHVGSDGSPLQIEVEAATNPGVFDAAAIAAVENWKFNPAQRDGAAVDSWVRVPVCFSLDELAPSCEQWPDALDGIWTRKPPKQG